MRILAFIAALFFVTAAHAAPVYVDVGHGHGSGFTIGNGLILTAGHVATAAAVDPESERQVVVVSTEDGKKAHAVVVWANYEDDVVLLKVVEDGWVEPPPSVLNCDATPAIGTEVELVGNPINEKFVHTWGRVGTGTITDNDFWPFIYLIDATIARGESGGAVTTGDGKVVGIIVGIDGDNSFGFVVPATTVCKLVDGNKS